MATRKQNVDENDFEALDRMARTVTPELMRPMSPVMRRRWKAAKRGRPRKPAEAKAVPTMITLEPDLLRRIDACTRKTGVSRSRFLAQAARQALKRVG